MTPSDVQTKQAGGDVSAKSAERPLRKDAQRTRQQVIEAATELFAERGLHVGFDDIARAAGVGVGTVYRRFPDRDALVGAVFEDRLADLLRRVDIVARIEDPWDAVVSFCELTITSQHQNRGFLEVIAAGGLQEGLEAFKPQMAAKGDSIVDRARRAGVVRPDVEGIDLAVSTHLFSRIAIADGSELWRRYLALFLDAIRAQPGHQPLPVAAPTDDTFTKIALRL